ncbi:hypothetical protein HBI37_113520 [Parastagonospora nodorum]|nr:hypothetical protein HBI09_007240 [Parastagonospora nodorum]KAH5027144.1 hypothetical protein HBI77_007240 [Parastagonospora nodorum]KAH5529351.1 hypothetical protein HBI29_014990 [Parastagonospora nodorum]KAH5784289.1 hypothetical protein HBI16_025880 [Parastagonospora nodorum]KAH6339915.1 hypothetical protein HBI37_113520 [Parastagonospora nodorum]
MFSKFAGAVSGAGSENAARDEGASLSSVLETPTLRLELALLVLLCIDTMRSDLVATFDWNQTQETKPPTTTRSPPPLPKNPSNDLISVDEPQHEKPVASDATRATFGREHDSMQMQALRRSALNFFDKWRGAVMLRICDVLSVRGETVRQAKARRKQNLDQAEKERQGTPSLIDFEEDPFASPAWTGKEKQCGRYNPIRTRLLDLEEPKRVLILHCLLLLLLSLEYYPAHSRVLLLNLASSFELETDVLAEHEKSVAQGLLATAASHMDADATAAKQASNDAASRKWKVGLAAVGGAVLIGVTGGLAAPLLAAGLGSVMGGLGLGIVSTYLGALASSSVLVGSLFGAYGAKMTGKLMEQYAREVQDFEFMPVQDPKRPSSQREQEWADEQDARDPSKRAHHRLRVAIGISGWLSSSADVYQPWEVIDAETTEPFALRFELDAMLRLGNSLQEVLFNYAWDGLTYTVVSRTLLGALYAGLWPLGLIKVASVLDNPFSVALARADKAGKVLAHALIDGVQGKRPVTLIGFSVGARVIHACLIELAEQHAFGLVESVVLMGTPAPSNSEQWRQIRSVVAARVVNVYSTEDYVLGYLYRSTKLEFGVSGLEAVRDVHGIENIDMSKLVSGHDRYKYLAGKILVNIGFGDVNFDKVAEQEQALEAAERKKQHVKEEAKKRVESEIIFEAPPHSSSGSIPNLIDDADEEKPPSPTHANAQPARQAPIIYTQSRSRQQPARQRPMMAQNMPTQAATPEAPRNPPSTATTTLDPLGATELIETSTHTVKQPSFPTASAMKKQQMPSKQISEPSAQAQPLRVPKPIRVDSVDGPIRLIDSTPAASSNNVSKGAQKPATAVTVTEVPIQHDDAESEMDFCEDDESEIGSEFGELSMVEPVPLDDFDYGLM